MQDQMLTLADDQLITGTAATGFVLSEHTINLGATFDPFNAERMRAIFTVKTTFTAATPGSDNLQIQIKATTGAAPITFGTKLIQALQLTVGHSSRYVVADLVKGKQIEIPLAATTLAQALSLIKPEGYLTLYALLVGEDASFAAVSFTAGAFDLDLRSDNPRGQKYYPQARSVG